MTASLPLKSGYVDITTFLPPAGAQGDPRQDPDFSDLVEAITRRRQPPEPLRVLVADNEVRLADRASWMAWLACRSVGSGIGVLPSAHVQVVESRVASAGHPSDGALPAPQAAVEDVAEAMIGPPEPRGRSGR